jgi:hypothetical protein
MAVAIAAITISLVVNITGSFVIEYRRSTCANPAQVIPSSRLPKLRITINQKTGDEHCPRILNCFEQPSPWR